MNASEAMLLETTAKASQKTVSAVIVLLPGALH